MANTKVIRKTQNDSLSVVTAQMEKARRQVTRLEHFGIIPEEVSVRILSNILSIREELKACQTQSQAQMQNS